MGETEHKNGLAKASFHDAVTEFSANPQSPPSITAALPTKVRSQELAPFKYLAVIDGRPLERECFVQCLQRQTLDAAVTGYASVAEWVDSTEAASTEQVILFNLGSHDLTDDAMKAEVRQLVSDADPIPVVILGAADELEAFVTALECGAVGYIPPGVHFPDILEATRLTVSGGMFLPRSSLKALRRSMPAPSDGASSILNEFTDRQLAVAQELRHGAANKTIAYRLNLCESTVKVHIRHIFHKLKATNRTQAAFLLNQINGWPETGVRDRK